MPLGRADRSHAGSGVQAGESAQQAGEPDEEPAVGAQLGDAAGECASSTLRPSARGVGVTLNSTYALVFKNAARPATLRFPLTSGHT